MADIVSKEKRSKMMSGIKWKDTRPEVTIRKALFKRGYRYRLHKKTLPGKPDIYFPKYKAVVFVHGCFWHRHDCHLFKMPSTRTEFWENKINGNRERDKRHTENLLALGLKILTIWECAWKGKEKRPMEEIADMTESFLKGAILQMEITGIPR